MQLCKIEVFLLAEIRLIIAAVDGLFLGRSVLASLLDSSLLGSSSQTIGWITNDRVQDWPLQLQCADVYSEEIWCWQLVVGEIRVDVYLFPLR